MFDELETKIKKLVISGEYDECFAQMNELYQMFIFYFVEPGEKEKSFIKEFIPYIKQYNLGRYSSDYFRASLKEDRASSAITHKILSMLIDGYRQGNEDCRNLLISAYSELYKKEYKQLQRFEKIDIYEIMNICCDLPIPFIKQQDIFSMVEEYHNPLTRILVMCAVMPVKLDISISPIVIQLNMRAREALENFEENSRKYEKIDEANVKYIEENSQEVLENIEELLDKFPSEFSKWTILKENSRWGAYLKCREFIKLCFMNNNLNVNYFDTYLAAYDYDKALIANTISLLLTFYDESVHGSIQDYMKSINSPEYLAPYISILQVVHCLGDSLDQAEDIVNSLFDTDNSKALEIKTKATVTNADNKEIPGDDVELKVAYEKRILELEQELRTTQSELKECREELRSTRKELSLTNAEVAAATKDKSELIHLRNYVYQLGTENDDYMGTELSLEEKERYIEKKRVCIIGGDTNWISKLKTRFKNWKFLTPGPSASNAGASAIDNCELTLFFTSCMKHSVYNLYISRCRQENLPYDYLHTVNDRFLIERVYKILQEQNM